MDQPGPSQPPGGARQCGECQRWLVPSSQQPGWTPIVPGGGLPAFWLCPDCSRAKGLL